MKRWLLLRRILGRDERGAVLIAGLLVIVLLFYYPVRKAKIVVTETAKVEKAEAELARTEDTLLNRELSISSRESLSDAGLCF
jgi:poly-D-alanine transfer protein DltD